MEEYVRFGMSAGGPFRSLLYGSRWFQFNEANFQLVIPCRHLIIGKSLETAFFTWIAQAK